MLDLLRADCTHCNHRVRYLQAHGAEAPLDWLAYATIVYVGNNEKGAEKLLWCLRSNKVAPQFSNPPGYHSPAVAAILSEAREPDRRDPRLETQLALDNVFAGTTDQVFQQLKNFWEDGHLLMMGRDGFITYDKNLRGKPTRKRWVQ